MATTDGAEAATTTAVVTAAASGIGRATAIELARASVRVVAADLDQEGLSRTAADIGRLIVEIVEQPARFGPVVQIFKAEGTQLIDLEPTPSPVGR